MKKELQFAFKGTNKVLEKLIVERDNKNNQAYKTLVNAYNEYSRIFWNQPISLSNDDLTKEEKLAYTKLVNKLSEEITKLEKVVEESLENNEYKAHHNWVYSYNNLVGQKNMISGRLL